MKHSLPGAKHGQCIQQDALMMLEVLLGMVGSMTGAWLLLKYHFTTKHD